MLWNTILNLELPYKNVLPFFSLKKSVIFETRKMRHVNSLFFSSIAPCKVYFVRRTRFGSLPVYLDIKGGGTKYLTLIRKVEGNAYELCKKLEKDLELKEKEAFVNNLTKHVIIKGSRVKQVKRILVKDGF